MKLILTLIILIVLFNPTFGQKHLEIPKTEVIESFMERLPENLKKLELHDFRTSEDSLSIRIWQTHNVFTIHLNYNSIFSNYKIYTKNKELILKSFNFSNNITQNIVDSLSFAKIMNLKNENYRGIDGSFVFIEISTNSKYCIFR